MADKFKKSNSLTNLETENQANYNAVKNYGDYTASDAVKLADQQKTNAINALSNYGDFSYKDQGLLDTLKNQIMNRDKFSYDLNGDALYQQYKDKYINQGRLAMQDTIGQASAMTGGYGNSYAATAGNQAYQASLQNLNDIVPQLYQMAYDQYVQEGQDMNSKYSLLSNDRAYEYGVWGDKRNQLVADRDYFTNEYYNKYNQDYGQYTDKYSMLRDLASLSETRATNQYNQEYGAYRDTVSDNQWQLNYDLQKSQADQANTIAALKAQIEALEEGEPDPEVDYSDWSATDWNEYFAQIRFSEGKSAAEAELDRLNKEGVIPKKYLSSAAVGARGSLGH